MESETFVHPTAVIDEGCQLGKGVKVWHFCHLMPGSVIGDHSSLGQNVFVASGVIVGRSVKVQNNVSLYEGVICEDDVFIGPSVVFTNVKNPRSQISQKNNYVKTVIRIGATIGANATIVCGNEIGAYAFVGAGSVVTKPVPPYAMVLGNPARQTGWVSRSAIKLSFDKNNEAVCSSSGEKYVLEEGQIKKLG